MAYLASQSDLNRRLPQPVPSSASVPSGATTVQSVNRAPTIKPVENDQLRLTCEREKEQALLALETDVARIKHGEIHLVSSARLTSTAGMSSRGVGYQLVKPGIPGHGIIFHYAQVHSVEIPGLLGQSGAPYSPSAAFQEKIRRCQRRIFDALLISDIKHVFSEGLEHTLVPDTFQAGSEFAACRDQFRACFRGYQPGQALNPKQEEMFYADGALIYGYVAKGVTLHPTTNPSQVTKLDAYYANPANREKFVANKFTTPQEDHSIFFADAEEAARVEIKRVMQGKSLSVALIFGRDHKTENFAANFDEKNFSPALYSKDMTD